ncbi:DUF1828 domain-containing protein [Microvirga sp. CF3016]|uniref:DUF1828 domain-containing protein n=1 Tax=Microvirga sp. CF3016 TaxID=3110181 RepID=UPI002E77E9BF|nr:DUF1828 domain-containing protein [Microvirga sp. CF3016]MEE1611136.1 DUF1828 domain-containing protein [Microvirga sp. CF3016]
MNTVDVLKKALCGTITTRRLASGVIAVGTEFNLSDGDQIGFYVSGKEGNYWIADDGSTIPFLEAQGVSFENNTRGSALSAMLAEYGFSYDEERAELISGPFSDEELPNAAMRFVSLRLRLQDFLLLQHPKTVANTFRDDVRQAIEATFEGKARLAFDQVVSESLPDIVADAIVDRNGVEPVAVFFGTNDMRLTEAQVLRLEAKYQAQVAVRVVSIVESQRPAAVSSRVLGRAMNRLDKVLVFRGEEKSAMQALMELVGIDSTVVGSSH